MKNIVVIGSSGAIGKAFIESYIKDSNIESIFSFSRSGIPIEDKKLQNFFIDIEDEKSIHDAASKIDKSSIDEIIVASGILHNKDFGPEKSIRDLNADNLLKVLKINTVGPALVGRYFIPLLNKKEKSILAFLSARVGSISDNKTGGWYAYRSSKTALNQIIKNFSIELRRTNPNAIIIGLQPGTVDSNLSEPFKRNVKEGNLFTPEYSVSMLKNIIDKASPCDSGKLIAWDGEEINP